MCSAISALRSARGTLIVCKLVRSRSTTVRPSVRDGLSQRKEEKEGGSWRLCMRWRTRGLASDRVLVQRSAGSGALQSARDAGQATQGSIISTYIHTYIHTYVRVDLLTWGVLRWPCRHLFAVGNQGRCCATCMSRGARRVVGASKVPCWWCVARRGRLAVWWRMLSPPESSDSSSPADGEGRTIGKPTYIVHGGSTGLQCCCQQTRRSSPNACRDEMTV